MKTPTLFSRRHAASGLDVLIAKLGLVAAVLLLGLQLFASRPYLLVIPLSMGVGSGLYLATRGESATATERLTLPSWIAGYVPAAVTVALALVVVLTRTGGGRSVPVYLLVGAIGAVIVGQILIVEDEALTPGTILFEILAAAVVVRLSALFVTPGYVGVDIWTHALVFVDGMASIGGLGPLAESKYVMAPLYHAAAAVGTLVFGTVRPGIYLTVGVVVPLATVFVYATSRLLVPVRWALLATVLYAFGDQAIRWGMHVIPTSLGLVFFLATVYLVARTFAHGAEPWAVSLALVASLAVVFTHQVSTTILLVFLGIAAAVAVGGWRFGDAATVEYAARKAVALVAVFVATLVTTIASWSVTPFAGSDSFLGREIAVLARTLAEDAGFLNLAGGGGSGGGGAAAGSSAFGWLIPYVELFGFALLLAASIVGGLRLLGRTERPDLSLTMLGAGAVLFVFVFGLSIFGVRALLPGRWMAFLYVPMSVLGAAGVLRLSRSDSRTLVAVALVVLAVGYPTTMVVAEKATLDSPAFDDQHTRYAYTDAEIEGAMTIRTVSPPAESGVFRTDHPYSEFFEVLGYEDGTLVVGPEGPVGANTTVARDYQSEGPPGFDRTPGAGTATTPVCPADWNRLYANDDVRLCTEPAGGET